MIPSASSKSLASYPADITYRQLIARNKRNSILLVLMMVSWYTILAGVIGIVLSGYGLAGHAEQIVIRWAAIGACTGVFLTLLGYFAGAYFILAASDAQPLEKSRDPELFNVVEELAIAGDMPTPRIRLIASPAMNAMAAGRNSRHATVAITTGLRNKLTREELTGVIAHEMSHIRFGDIRFNAMMATLAGFIVLMVDAYWRLMFSGTRSKDVKTVGKIMLLCSAPAVLLLVIGPLLAMSIQFAVSREREFLADAGSVALTRNPQGLIAALLKLADDPIPLATANRATEYLYISNPRFNAGCDDAWKAAFATHPLIRERIARLEALMR